MYFSIAAPQNVPLPDGRVLSFRVNPVDTSLVELHIAGADHNDAQGTHVLTFKRNGAAQDTQFVPTAQPALKEDIPGTPVPVPPVPYADAPSVDEDAVRANSWPTQPPNKVRTSSGQPAPDRGYKTPVDDKPAA